MGPFFGGLGSAKGSQGLHFEENPCVFFNHSIFGSERFLEGPERVPEVWGGAKAAPRGANKDLLANFGSPKWRSWKFGSKMGIMLREHEIPKSIWRYYTSENGDCRLNTKLDV